MEKRICKEQASYRIVDSGPVCVIYSSFESNYNWIGTITFNEPSEFKLVLPKGAAGFKPIEFSPSSNKQLVVNWFIDTNEIQLASRISCQSDPL